MIILLLCIACSEFKINVTPVASTTETAILSKEEACEIAMSAITDFYPEKVTVKSDGSSPQISVSSVISIVLGLVGSRRIYPFFSSVSK